MTVKSKITEIKQKYKFKQLESELDKINIEVRDLFTRLRDRPSKKLANLEIPSKLLAFQSRIIEIIKILKKMQSEITSQRSKLEASIYNRDDVKKIKTIKEKNLIVSSELRPIDKLETLIDININFGYDLVSLLEKSYYLLKQMVQYQKLED